MGLDMYLTKKIYIGANYDHNNITGSIDIKVRGKSVKIDFNKVTYVIEDAGYWRKANAIHNWFVVNCQDNKDECQESDVPWEKMEELKKLCNRVLENRNDHSLIGQILPPTEGFFFGSYEIDEDYFKDIKDTLNIINSLDPKGDYFYSASW